MSPKSNSTPKDTDNQITDLGSERKYFSSIPHLIDDMGLTPYAVRLYLRIKRRAGETPGGKCFENTKNMAAACKMSQAQISRSKKELKEAGLITIEKGESKHGEYPPDHIYLVDIWAQNMGHYGSITVSTRNGQPFLPETDRFQEKQDRFYQRVKEKPLQEKPSQEKNQEKPSLSAEADVNGPSSVPKKKEPSQKELTRINLEKYFLEVSGLPAPKSKTTAEAKKANKLWWTNERELLEWVGWDLEKAGILVKEAVKHHRENGLSIGTFASIMSVARSKCGEYNSGTRYDSGGYTEGGVRVNVRPPSRQASETEELAGPDGKVSRF